MINVVIVTYGDRWHLLVRVLEHLCFLDVVGKVIVVDNDSKYDVSSHCHANGFSKVEVTRMSSNQGSAGGYYYGISQAIHDPDRLILLLDDDNLPQEGAIEGLIFTYANRVSQHGESLFAVAAYRESQHGGFRMPVKPPFLLDQGFLGFNVFNAVQRHFGLIKYAHSAVTGYDFTRYHKGQPYGGLLFSPKLISEIGLPKRELVLYFDDIEFTSRLINDGGDIYVDYSSQVEDIEDNYSASLFKTPIFGFVSGGYDSKIFYILRNRSYIDKYICKKSSIFYMANKYLFFAAVVIASILTLRFSRVVTVLRSLRCSNVGRLGFHPKYQL